MPESVMINGQKLSLEDLIRIGYKKTPVDFPKEILEKLREVRGFVERSVERGEIYYGVTTGFGFLAHRIIEPELAEKLQLNLLRSHSVGVGDYAPEHIVRMTMAIRMNTLAKGMSGIRPEILYLFKAFLNKSVYPLIPLKGSVGASGDLAPLSHLALALIGDPSAEIIYEGKKYTGIALKKVLFDKIYGDLPDDLKKKLEISERNVESGEPLIKLSYKEGLALNNGTAFSAALLADAIIKLRTCFKLATFALALSLEGLAGFIDPFTPEIFESKYSREFSFEIIELTRESRLVKSNSDPIGLDLYAEGAERKILKPQAEVTFKKRVLRGYGIYPISRLKNLSRLNPDGFEFKETDKSVTLIFRKMNLGDLMGKLKYVTWKDIGIVQDPYSIRCSPQIYGSFLEALDFATRILEREINTACDNPLIVKKDNEYYVISCGNFHGQTLGLASDVLGVAISNLSNISERRTQLLLDSKFNRGLTDCLIHPESTPGLNSGLMIAQYTSAALAAENRALASPFSVHSIPTSANQEDIVSMCTNAALRLHNMIENLTNILLIEVAAALQAILLRAEMLNTNTEDLLGVGMRSIVGELIGHIQRRGIELPLRSDIYLKSYIDAVHQALKKKVTPQL